MNPESRTPIKVALVEDDGITRVHLSQVIQREPGFKLVGSYASAEAALDGVPPHPPDVLLLDVQLPGISGIECLRRLIAVAPQLRVIMLTGCGETQVVLDALRAGARGYVLKDCRTRQLIEAIRQTHHGIVQISLPVAATVSTLLDQVPAPDPALEKLTEQERRVLDALARGRLYKETGDDLSITENSLRTYVKRIYRKLGVTTRVEAVAKLGARRPPTG